MLRPLPSWAALVGLILLCLAVGAIGGWASAGPIRDWYPSITKPGWNPPNWVFGPVWTLLYVLMAIAAWLVWKKNPQFSGVRIALNLFFLQLALNLAWTFIFFAAHSPGWALIEIAVFWLAIAATLYAFWSHSRLAGLMLAPYLAWASFAAVLNAAIWRLN
jgi:translocator protein